MIETKEHEGVLRMRMSRSVLGRPLYFTACFLVDGLLIDTGCTSCAHEFSRAVRGLRIAQILNTHSHEDHIGNNALLQKSVHAPIFCSPQAISLLEHPERLALSPYQKFLWGLPPPSQGIPVGKTVDTPSLSFRVIDTPGHSPDHICLHEPNRGWLFCGDAFVGGRDRVLREGFDIVGILSSLKKLTTLGISVMFSGSGTIYAEPQKHLEEKISYLEGLRRSILDLHGQGKDVPEIASRLFGGEPWIYYVTGGKFSSRNLVSSMLRGNRKPSLRESARGRGR